MKNWEFLLQREGDTTWLPLETPDVEILEGRYRVVARSGYPNAKIEVRITHHALEETPPVRRVQTRTTNTSGEGLMVVIPYTRLKPGIWELSCSPHLQAALVNKSSENLVKLRVLSSDSEPLEEPSDFNPPQSSDSDVETVSDSDTEDAVTIYDADDRDLDENQHPETATTEKSIVEIIDERNSTSQTPPPDAQPEPEPELIVIDSTQTEETEPPEESQESSSSEIAIAIDQSETQPEPELIDIDSTQTEETEPSESSSPEIAIADEQIKEPSVEIESLNGDSPQPVTSESPSDDLSVNVDDIQLKLQQDSYVAKLGQALLISGQIEPAESLEELEGQSLKSSLDQPQLKVYLRDPHNFNTLLQVQQKISLDTLPTPFSCIIYIPFQCQTRLILGEIVISSGGESITNHSFTIATQVEHLLTAIGGEFTSFEEIDISIEDDQPDEEIEPKNRLKLIDPNAPPSPEPPPSEPYTRRPTVPVTQANPQTAKKETASPPSSLELPSFGHFISDNSTRPVEEAKPTPEQPTSASGEATDAEILTPTDETSQEPVNSQTDPDDSGEAQLVPVTPVDPAFRALNLENRFWSRLNALAQDQDLSQWMKKAKPTPFPDTSFVQTRPDDSPKPSAPPPQTEAEPLFPPLEEDWESQEIVVDDEPQPETTPSSASSQPSLRLLSSNPRLSPSEAASALSEDEPIPPPILEVIDSEIIAGRTVKVRVCMSDNLPRIYVKIWVYDRQSRSIVDGPRWLTEFSPNGLNQIETTVNLEIAYGSLEVQFEAIAVEMQTQRESHKVIVERSVVPPAAPTLPLDEE
ncbi:hypothetical protein ACL6C3_11020 [Capilliphycus salinus ALCB114379]|uniref:hypothetical protein n=1 Tax=Capilliphycus salinus TaxID=2768948 RepID=UPI0039A4CB75